MVQNFNIQFLMHLIRKFYLKHHQNANKCFLVVFTCMLKSTTTNLASFFPVLSIEFLLQTLVLAEHWLPLGKSQSDLNPAHNRSFFVSKMILSSDESPLPFSSLT